MRDYSYSDEHNDDVLVLDRNYIMLPRAGIYRMVGKRMLDIFLVLFFSPIVVPVVLAFAVLIALDGGNPFYTQYRVGKNGRHFRMWKLRSMVVDADRVFKEHLAKDPAAKLEWDATQKLVNDPRITKIGKLIRKTSIDELPQLFNVLNGSMSLVGPRPMMVSQKHLYTGQGYYELRPGLTGMWQVSDRHRSDFIDRVGYDDLYNRDVSFKTDLSIIWKTVFVLFRCTGV